MPLVYYIPVPGFRVSGPAIVVRGKAFTAGRATEIGAEDLAVFLCYPIFTLSPPSAPAVANGLPPKPSALPPAPMGDDFDIMNPHQLMLAVKEHGGEPAIGKGSKAANLAWLRAHGNAR